MNLQHRSYQKEWMDQPQQEPGALHANLSELIIINRFTGGYRPMYKAVKALLKKADSKAVIVDVGSGAGDFLNYLHRHRELLPCSVELAGLDREAFAVQYAFQRFPDAAQNVQWINDDYSQLKNYIEKPDIITAGLFCHHLDDSELVGFFRFCYQYSRLGFVVSDLRRHPVAYYSIKCLTRLFSRSKYTRHDAPLSVRRGFREQELHYALNKAGIKRYEISRKWAYRFLITVPAKQTES